LSNNADLPFGGCVPAKSRAKFFFFFSFFYNKFNPNAKNPEPNFLHFLFRLSSSGKAVAQHPQFRTIPHMTPPFFPLLLLPDALILASSPRAVK